MGNSFIFVFGCVVFGVTIASAFIAVMASDHPDDAS